MFKGLLDGANAFIEGLTKIFRALDKVHLALPTVIAGFLAFKSVIGALAGEKGGGATVKAIEGIGKAIGAISKEGSVIGGLSSTLSGAFTSMGASATVASAGVTVLSGGLAILGTMLVGGAIYKGMEYLSNHYKRVGDASRTRQEELKGEIQAIQQQAGSLSQIAGRYDELNIVVAKFAILFLSFVILPSIESIYLAFSFSDEPTIIPCLYSVWNFLILSQLFIIPFNTFNWVFHCY